MHPVEVLYIWILFTAFTEGYNKLKEKLRKK